MQTIAPSKLHKPYKCGNALIALWSYKGIQALKICVQDNWMCWSTTYKYMLIAHWSKLHQTYIYHIWVSSIQHHEISEESSQIWHCSTDITLREMNIKILFNLPWSLKAQVVSLQGVFNLFHVVCTLKPQCIKF